MEKVQRFRFVAIVGVVMAVLSAGFALAGDAFDDPADEPTPTTCEPTGDDPIEDGDTVEDSEDPEGTDDGESEEGEDPAEGEDSDGEIRGRRRPRGRRPRGR